MQVCELTWHGRHVEVPRDNRAVGQLEALYLAIAPEQDVLQARIVAQLSALCAEVLHHRLAQPAQICGGIFSRFLTRKYAIMGLHSLRTFMRQMARGGGGLTSLVASHLGKPFCYHAFPAQRIRPQMHITHSGEMYHDCSKAICCVGGI